MNSLAEISGDRTVALTAEVHHVGVGDGATVVGYQGFPVLGIVAIQAAVIRSMFQGDVGVLGDGVVDRVAIRPEVAMALVASVLQIASNQNGWILGRLVACGGTCI
jgi:hypothetical protein